MTHTTWWLAVDALATLRLTVLLARDQITAPAREWVRERAFDAAGVLRSDAWRWTFDLITCLWCVSLWLGGAVVVLTKFAPEAWQYPAMALALSAVAGWLGDR